MNRPLSAHLALLLGLIGLALPAAHASRTGLNNIPIADVSPAGTGVVQGYSSFGPARKTSCLSGARIGFETLGERFELGFDSRWEPGPVAPFFFNFKWASRWRRSLPALGLGIANAAPRREDRGPLGQPQSYAVLSHDAHFARLHAGYAVQFRNPAAFFGLDRSWLLAGRKLTFRADLTEIQNRDQWLGSAGITYKLSPTFTFELWQSQPTRIGRAYTTAKLGWQFLTQRKFAGVRFVGSSEIAKKSIPR